ncbi:hypothetical protein DIPPA_04990 [Diplonema papillatum]|nr:hypothetical protein DIPPA_04990 [Diplonema papillatum]
MRKVSFCDDAGDSLDSHDVRSGQRSPLPAISLSDVAHQLRRICEADECLTRERCAGWSESRLFSACLARVAAKMQQKDVPKVLLVAAGDEEMSQAGQLLLALGIDVVEAAHAKEATEKCKSSVHFVLVDLATAGLNGSKSDLLAFLAAMTPRCAAPVAAVLPPAAGSSPRDKGPFDPAFGGSTATVDDDDDGATEHTPHDVVFAGFSCFFRKPLKRAVALLASMLLQGSARQNWSSDARGNYPQISHILGDASSVGVGAREDSGPAGSVSFRVESHPRRPGSDVRADGGRGESAPQGGSDARTDMGHVDNIAPQGRSMRTGNGHVERAPESRPKNPSSDTRAEDGHAETAAHVENHPKYLTAQCEIRTLRRELELVTQQRDHLDDDLSDARITVDSLKAQLRMRVASLENEIDAERTMRELERKISVEALEDKYTTTTALQETSLAGRLHIDRTLRELHSRADAMNKRWENSRTALREVMEQRDEHKAQLDEATASLRLAKAKMSDMERDFEIEVRTVVGPKRDEPARVLEQSTGTNPQEATAELRRALSAAQARYRACRRRADAYAAVLCHAEGQQMATEEVLTVLRRAPKRLGLQGRPRLLGGSKKNVSNASTQTPQRAVVALSTSALDHSDPGSSTPADRALSKYKGGSPDNPHALEPGATEKMTRGKAAALTIFSQVQLLARAVKLVHDASAECDGFLAPLEELAGGEGKGVGVEDVREARKGLQTVFERVKTDVRKVATRKSQDQSGGADAPDHSPHLGPDHAPGGFPPDLTSSLFSTMSDPPFLPQFPPTGVPNFFPAFSPPAYLNPSLAPSPHPGLPPPVSFTRDSSFFNLFSSSRSTADPSQPAEPPEEKRKPSPAELPEPPPIPQYKAAKVLEFFFVLHRALVKLFEHCKARARLSELTAVDSLTKRKQIARDLRQGKPVAEGDVKIVMEDDLDIAKQLAAYYDSENRATRDRLRDAWRRDIAAQVHSSRACQTGYLYDNPLMSPAVDISAFEQTLASSEGPCGYPASAPGVAVRPHSVSVQTFGVMPEIKRRVGPFPAREPIKVVGNREHAALRMKSRQRARRERLLQTAATVNTTSPESVRGSVFSHVPVPPALPPVQYR